jgi:hypothetical protein
MLSRPSGGAFFCEERGEVAGECPSLLAGASERPARPAATRPADRLVDVRQRRHLVGRPRHHNRVFQFALVRLQFLEVGGLDDHHVAEDFSPGAWRPGLGSNGEVDAGVRLDDTGVGRPALPAFRQRPGFLMDIRQAISLHLLGGPVGGALEVF